MKITVDTNGTKTIEVPLIERALFQNNNTLDEKDLQLEQMYYDHKDRRHSQNLGIWGIVYGLVVTLSQNELIISPGYAIDREGREIILPPPEDQNGITSEMAEIASFRKADTSSQKAPGNLKIKLETGFLCISWMEKEVDKRYFQQGTIAVKAHPRPGMDIVLGKIEKTSDQNTYKEEGREYCAPHVQKIVFTSSSLRRKKIGGTTQDKIKEVLDEKEKNLLSDEPKKDPQNDIWDVIANTGISLGKIFKEGAEYWFYPKPQGLTMEARESEGTIQVSGKMAFHCPSLNASQLKVDEASFKDRIQVNQIVTLCLQDKNIIPNQLVYLSGWDKDRKLPKVTTQKQGRPFGIVETSFNQEAKVITYGYAELLKDQITRLISPTVGQIIEDNQIPFGRYLGDDNDKIQIWVHCL